MDNKPTNHKSLMIPSKMSKKEKCQKQAERLKQLTQPRGAFMSQRPKIESIDIELREIQLREEEFNQMVQRELGRLNFPLSDIPPSPKKSRRPVSSFGYSLVTSLKPSPKTPQVVPVTPITPITPGFQRRRKRFNTNMTFSDFIKNQSPVTQALPCLVKSIPIHQDPNFKFTQVKKPEKKDPNKAKRIEDINSIIGKLSSVDKIDHSSIDDSLKKTSRMSKSVYDCISTLCDSEKFGLGITLSTIVHQQNDAAKLSEFILNETNHATNELNQTVSQVLTRSKRSRYSDLN